MSKPYRHTAFKRFGNGILTPVIRSGRGPKPMRVVTVRGRTYFATSAASDEELRALAPEHTVFKLEPA